MFINDIEYNLRLYVVDEETEEDIAEKVFQDFEEMNAFLDKTEMMPEYKNAKAEYTFVEVVNGIPEMAGRYFFDISPYMPLLKEEIDDILYEMRVIVPKEEEEQRKIWEKNQLFTPEKIIKAAGDASKEIPLNEYVYLCHKCLNELDKCTCQSYPMYTIQIDRLLAPIIRILNFKGYLTSSCCAGHPGYQNGSMHLMYVSFRERYTFSQPFPDGFRYLKDGNTLCSDLPDCWKDMNLDEQRQFQKDYIEKLKSWAESL